MWQEGVRSSNAAMGLSELSTARFIALSRRGAEILGTTVQDGIGLNYLDVVEPSSAAAESFHLARQGIIDGTRTRRQLRRPDGSVVEVQATGWAIRSPAGPDLGLWLATEVSSAGHAAVAEEVVAPSFPLQPYSGLDGARVTLDHRWHVTHVRSTAGLLLGREPDDLLGRSLIEFIHPDDLPVLLFGLARATTDRDARALLRLRHRNGTWRVVQVAPTIVENEAALVAVGLASWNDANAPIASDRVVEIPGELRLIADQIEAAGVLAPLAETAGALGVAAITDLSPRQWEVVSRLARGERVATISEKMYLSPSTVRNHLSAIFAKIGVHSQAELVALLRAQRPTGPADRTESPSAT
jgi:PAS domain S-box-containing protein